MAFFRKKVSEQRVMGEGTVLGKRRRRRRRRGDDKKGGRSILMAGWQTHSISRLLTKFVNKRFESVKYEALERKKYLTGKQFGRRAKEKKKEEEEEKLLVLLRRGAGKKGEKEEEVSTRCYVHSYAVCLLQTSLLLHIKLPSSLSFRNLLLFFHSPFFLATSFPLFLYFSCFVILIDPIFPLSSFLSPFFFFSPPPAEGAARKHGSSRIVVYHTTYFCWL